MAVDFAYKQRKRRATGFALRTVKLRMSRKLIYISGLLACFTYELSLTPDECAALFADPSRFPVLAHLRSVFGKSPLEILAANLLRHPSLDSYSAALLRAYDEFLGILADVEKRKRLDELTYEQLDGDPLFREARLVSYRFRDAVGAIFLRPDNLLGELTIEYGVF
jgi:hypothetical protein